MRAYQGLVWRAGDKTAPPEFTANQPLSSFSWKMEEDILVSNHDLPADASQHHLVHKGCHVPHTVWCKGDEQCANYSPITKQNTSMAETDEENEDDDELAH